jgi:hypothetical protein
MAPASLPLLPRQFGNGDGNGPFGDRDGSDGNGVSKWAIIGIVIAILVIAAIMGLVIFRRLRRRRRLISAAINLTSTAHHKPTSTGPSGNSGSGSGGGGSSGPPKYGAGTTGYGATPDQNHSLLGNAEPPAIVMWNAPHGGDNAASSSTQDGFGYDNNLQLAAGAGGIQRPASVASFSAPPPRYEEATNSNSNSRPPQGEAASYFNATVPMGAEDRDRDRGRSRSRDAAPLVVEGSRGRALSVDTRSMNGDRRRSISRFREEGMVDVNVNVEKS